MTLQRGTLNPPARRETQFTYIKMLTAQADATLGKLKRGDCAIVDVAKATRFCYVAKIARPATKEEYDKFAERRFRTRGGRGAYRPAYAIPDQSEFQLVEPNTADWNEADSDYNPNSQLPSAQTQTGDPNAETDLGDRLSGINDAGDDDEDEDSDSEDPEDEDDGTDPTYQEPEASGGHYTDSISGPEPYSAPDAATGRGRGRGRARL